MASARYSVPGEIKDTADSFYRAVAKRNLRAIDSLWAHKPYAAVAGPSGSLHQGWKAVQSYWQWRLGDEQVAQPILHLTNMVCHAVGDVGWFSGTEVRVYKTGDAEQREEVRVTCVLERAPEGWEIVSYHASLASPPALAEVS